MILKSMLNKKKPESNLYYYLTHIQGALLIPLTSPTINLKRSTEKSDKPFKSDHLS
jgi:hypothetical protein